MSYFIFKDIHSCDMKILVQRLPPITLPPKRYNIREIDGNNKSNIETYGYKTYEKTISIGFKENNINSVLNWLDGNGKLILSNEPNKYYEAYILEQIDYERALRFKTANVSFLVQPYKLCLEDENTESRIVYNQGNVECLPIMTIYGSGPISLFINGILVCRITNLNEYITLDSDEQEAYKGLTLQNRNMIGEFPKFKPGENTIICTGNVTKVNTLVRSRWI